MNAYRISRTEGFLPRWNIQVINNGRHGAWQSFPTREAAVSWAMERKASRAANGMGASEVQEWNGTEWAEVAAMRER